MKNLLFVISIAVLFLTSCSTTRNTSSSEQNERIVYNDRIAYKTDSIYIHDSTYVEVKGDTVRIVKYRDMYIDRATHDTITRIDTLRVTKTVTVQKDLTTWGKIKSNITGACLVMLLITFLWFVRQRIRVNK
jgi:ATP-dependent Zn protease